MTEHSESCNLTTATVNQLLPLIFLKKAKRLLRFTKASAATYEYLPLKCGFTYLTEHWLIPCQKYRMNKSALVKCSMSKPESEIGF